MFTVLLLFSWLACAPAGAKIGETQEEMIQRLGEPKVKIEAYCWFSLQDVYITASFNNGVCYGEMYDLDKLKANGRERVKRIEALLRGSSGDRPWEIVNLSGAGVEWETTDGALKAKLYAGRHGDGMEETLIIEDKVVQETLWKERAGSARISIKKSKIIFIVLFVTFCVAGAFVYRRWELISPIFKCFLWWVAAFYVPALVFFLSEIAFPGLIGFLFLLGIVSFIFAIVMAVDQWKKNVNS